MALLRLHRLLLLDGVPCPSLTPPRPLGSVAVGSSCWVSVVHFVVSADGSLPVNKEMIFKWIVNVCVKSANDEPVWSLQLQTLNDLATLEITEVTAFGKEA